MSVLNVYSVRDTVANAIVCTFSCPNDGLAIRENAPALSKVAPLGDLEISQLGELDSDTMELKAIPRRIISWDSYKFPESPIKSNPAVTPIKK